MQKLLGLTSQRIPSQPSRPTLPFPFFPRIQPIPVWSSLPSASQPVQFPLPRLLPATRVEEQPDPAKRTRELASHGRYFPLSFPLMILVEFDSIYR
jgi:hypothetical protein